jgi:hypothetical protein
MNDWIGGTKRWAVHRAVAIPALGWRRRVELRHICRFEKTVRFGIPSVAATGVLIRLLRLTRLRSAGPLPKIALFAGFQQNQLINY